jgi:thioredoxin reductase
MPGPKAARGPLWDVIVVGAGPAGLSAALILGRCRRRVLVFDVGRPRNARAKELHGFLSRDGTPPLRLLQIARGQLRKYPTVALRRAEVTDVRVGRGGFNVVAQGRRLRARFVLLATGVVDHLPEVPGLRRYYGRGVFHCPYCDGWENRDQPLAVYGRGRNGTGLAQELLTWSRDVTLCTDGLPLAPVFRARLEPLGIAVEQRKIARLLGRRDRLEAIEFADGARWAGKALFLSTGHHQRSPLAVKLACAFTGKGALKTTRFQMTNRPGLFAAGDCSWDVQLAIIAAAEGARAAFAMNRELTQGNLGGLGAKENGGRGTRPARRLVTELKG